MANYLILSDCVQGLPSTLTLNGTPGGLPVPSLATSITGRQVGQYFYKGAVVADTDLGDASAITRLVGLNAILAQ
jgi:hypothetical protein